MRRSPCQPSSRRGRRLKTIAIVGAGFSGTALAARLLEKASPVRVLLFDRTGSFGAGVAYGTDEPLHLLNVPAGKMSAFEERPTHFTDWLASREIEIGDGFLPRRVYRRYLAELLETPPAHSGSRLEKISTSVIAIDDSTLVSATGDRYQADAVVLATGYLPETRLGVAGPFAPFRPETWPSEWSQVVIVGSNLTALDAAASVFARSPRARVTFVSRHGLTPAPFDPLAPAYSLSCPPPTEKVRSILSWLRREISLAEAAGMGWASVFDAMRPRWEGLWQSLPEGERRRFVHHLARRFDRFRHRVPPALDAMLAPHWEDGSLSVRPGRVTRMGEGFIEVDGSPISAELVLDGSGSSPDWTRSSDSLAWSLLAAQRVQPGPLGMGIVADAQGEISPGLFVLGPPLKGVRWETTAVPEIRRQVKVVCDAL